MVPTIERWKQEARIDHAVEEAYQVFVNHKLSDGDALIAVKRLKRKVKEAQESFTLSALPQHTHQQSIPVELHGIQPREVSVTYDGDSVKLHVLVEPCDPATGASAAATRQPDGVPPVDPQ